MNCIAPGPIYTEGAFSRLDPSGHFTNEAMKNLPVGRLGEVEEIVVVGSKVTTGYSDPAHDNSSIEAVEQTKVTDM